MPRGNLERRKRVPEAGDSRQLEAPETLPMVFPYGTIALGLRGGQAGGHA